MSVYYNENDEEKAAWIRELIKRNIVAPGEVDERSIKEVRPDDLRGFKQCHFFAGIAVWSYSLRLAGWPDDRPCWSGSCPCQPFSAAGKGDGFDDERHLWPSWFYLARERKPPVLFGEQVEAAINHGWLDLVQADLEAEGYAFASVGLCAAGVGAPHIRQRVYFVAHSKSLGSGAGLRDSKSREVGRVQPADRCELVHADNGGFAMHRRSSGEPRHAECSSEGIELVHAERKGLEGYAGNGDDRDQPRRFRTLTTGHASTAGFTRGFWERAEWVRCKDGKSRPVEPGTFPLATGAPARVLRLRGYGDAINAEVAKAFIASYMEIA